MARGGGVRRKTEEVVAIAMRLAKQGPFTPQEFADKVGFGPNRARQVLEAMPGKQLVELGNRKSPRGKPAVLWGLARTKLTKAHTEPRPGRGGGKRAGTTAMVREVASEPSVGAVLVAFLDQLSSRGLEVSGPGGIAFKIRLGNGAAAAAPKKRKARGTGRRARRGKTPAVAAKKKSPNRPRAKKTAHPKAKPAPKPLPAKVKKRVPAKLKPVPESTTSPAGEAVPAKP